LRRFDNAVKRRKLPVFELSADGLSLGAADEEGKFVDRPYVCAFGCLRVKNQTADTIAAYHDAPNV
jgi:hypothetical protein